MNAKILDLVRWVEEGFEIRRIVEAPSGGMNIKLERRGRVREISLYVFEIPAMLQECSCVGVAK